MFERSCPPDTQKDFVTLLTKLDLANPAQDLGHLEWNVRSGHTTWDQTWSELFQLSAEVFAGNAGMWEKLIHANDLPIVIETLNEHLAGNTSHFFAEYRLAHNNAEAYSIRTGGIVVSRNSRGRPTHVIMISWKITVLESKPINSEAYSLPPGAGFAPFPD